MTSRKEAKKKLALVAFGGNALLRPEDRGTQEEQIARAKQAARWLAEIVRGMTWEHDQ